MKTLVRSNSSIAWLVLITLTLGSWTLGTSHSFGDYYAFSSLTIIVVAVFKVRLVGLYFMELRGAPLWLRGIFESYCAALPVLLGATYLLF